MSILATSSPLNSTAAERRDGRVGEAAAIVQAGARVAHSVGGERPARQIDLDGIGRNAAHASGNQQLIKVIDPGFSRLGVHDDRRFDKGRGRASSDQQRTPTVRGPLALALSKQDREQSRPTSLGDQSGSPRGP
jgi:hypothetical protein